MTGAVRTRVPSTMTAVFTVALCLAAATGCSTTTCEDSSICGNGNGRNDLWHGGDGGDGAREPEAENPPGGLEPGDDIGRKPRATPGTVRFSGDVLIAGEIDLDSDPPGASEDVDSLTFGGTDLYHFALAMTGIGTMGTTAEWEDDRAPTRAECDDHLARFAVPGSAREISGVGSSFCVRTSEGRTAFVHLKEKTETGYMLAVVTWEDDG